MMAPFLWSVRVSRFWEPWEAWIEDESGRMIRSTFGIGWTRASAERRARKRWHALQVGHDVAGTKKGRPVTTA